MRESLAAFRFSIATDGRDKPLSTAAIAELGARSNRCGGESLLIRKPHPSEREGEGEGEQHPHRSIGVVKDLADWPAFFSCHLLSLHIAQDNQDTRTEMRPTPLLQVSESEDETQHAFDPLHMHLHMRDSARAVSTTPGERRDVIYTLYLHLILHPTCRVNSRVQRRV